MQSAERDRMRAMLAGSAPVTWVITGDSITQGLVHTHGARSYQEHLHELIRGELGRRRDVLVNSAVSGHRVADILGDWERRVSSWRPEVVALMIGTNDCSTGPGRSFVTVRAFADDVAAAVDRVRDAGAIPVLQTPPAVDTAAAPERARFADFVAAVREVAASRRAVLVDQEARFAALGDGFPSALMNDAFHPNAAGHAALAEEFAAVVGIAPERSATLRALAATVAHATGRGLSRRQ